ncbi:MAG: protoporphyrinogen oxidase HemJ [Pseudomonadota bacterium]
MYEWVKAFHILAVISWMCGLLYLPRLLIYHFDSETGSVQSDTFKIMERRLLKAIMLPAMLVTWVLGIWLVFLTAAYSEGWFVTKFFLVVLMTAFHGFQSKWVKEFAAEKRLRSTKFYRFANEGPTVLMILIVILVVVKPF